ncbi:MAG TPA: PQQ-binding-like beta-propeller repeat protein [Polyangiaceae bacterium]|nr:PQQ-binding-like beta-propeller repeat protein [Polyangiaceae bacterium]
MAAAPDPTPGLAAARGRVGPRPAREPERGQLRPALALLRPAWLVALLALLLNDHVLKGAGILPRWLTGKVSDVAGLVVAPALLALVVRARGRVAVAACHAAVGLGFSLLKTVPGAAEAWSQALSWLVPSRLWCDSTDLVALPALALSWRLLAAARPQSPSERERGRHLVAAALGLFGCVATSRWEQPPAVPRGDMIYLPKAGGDVDVLDRATGRRRLTLYDRAASELAWGRRAYRAEGERIFAHDIDAPMRHWVAASTLPGWSLTPLEADDTRLYAFARPVQAKAEPGYLMAFEAARGTKLWSYPERVRLITHHLIEGWFFLHAERDGARTLLALDAASGATRWALPLGDRHAIRPVVVNDLVLVGVSWADKAGREPDQPLRERGELWAVEATTGRTRWTFATSSWRSTYKIGATTDVAIVASDQTIDVIDLASGRKIRGYPAPYLLTAEPAAGIWPALRGHAIVGVRPADGTEAWHTPLPSIAMPNVAVAGGVFYVSGDPGYLLAIEAKSGRIRWQFEP